jgi:phospholipid-binding lipoprotein MlaA
MTICRPRLSLIATAMVASGCATTAAPDPIEPYNRKVFAFNEHVDSAVIKPVAKTYVDTVPTPVRKGVTNFYDNARDLWSAANLLMQGEFKDGSLEVVRFGMNTTIGVLGLFDVATSQGLERHHETFGRTLGRWGLEPGAYVVWPILGPSTARDSVGLPLDLLATPLSLITGVPAAVAFTSTELVNQRALALPLTKMIDEIALDKYLYVRDAYLQRHRMEPRGKKSERAADPSSAASQSTSVTPSNPIPPTAAD